MSINFFNNENSKQLKEAVQQLESAVQFLQDAQKSQLELIKKSKKANDIAASKNAEADYLATTYYLSLLKIIQDCVTFFNANPFYSSQTILNLFRDEQQKTLMINEGLEKYMETLNRNIQHFSNDKRYYLYVLYGILILIGISSFLLLLMSLGIPAIPFSLIVFPLFVSYFLLTAIGGVNFANIWDTQEHTLHRKNVLNEALNNQALSLKAPDFTFNGTCFCKHAPFFKRGEPSIFISFERKEASVYFEVVFRSENQFYSYTERHIFSKELTGTLLKDLSEKDGNKSFYERIEAQKEAIFEEINKRPYSAPINYSYEDEVEESELHHIKKILEQDRKQLKSTFFKQKNLDDKTLVETVLYEKMMNPGVRN